MGCMLAMERAPLGVTQQALKASYADGVLFDKRRALCLRLVFAYTEK